jgi:valyl-tRNA synthetase
MARTLRAEAKLDPKLQLEGVLYCRNSTLAIAEKYAAAIRELAKVNLAFQSEAAPKAAAMRSTAQFDLVLQLPKSHQEAQGKRLEKDREQLRKNVENIRRQLSDETFMSKAPPHVVESLRKKLADYEAQLQKIDAQLGHTDGAL